MKHATESKRWRSLRLATSVVAATGSLIFLIVACGDTSPNAGGNGTLNQPTGSCSTPNEGCPCDSPGTKVACGRKVTGDLNFIFCYEGTRVCGEDGRWGDCGDGTVKTKAISHLRVSALGTIPTQCTAGIYGNTISVCTAGKNQGEFCTSPADCVDGDRRCKKGDPDDDKDCRNEEHCTSTCEKWAGHCQGGGARDTGCNVAADCTVPGSTCVYPGGATCGSFTGACKSSDPLIDGEACNADADCGPGGQCNKVKFGVCIGGKHNGEKCENSSKCKSSKGGTVGVCSNEVSPDAGLPPIDPCDPYCNILADTADGLDAGTGFLAADGGITSMGCGDGLVVLPEACDDGNTTSGDGCDSSCKLEPNFQCPTPGAACIPAVCGNGVQEGLEACDDTPVGQTDRPYDGCYKCQKEVSCPVGSACLAVCGDGIVMGAEACDDGNLTNGDGCSSTCTVETGATCVNAAAPAPTYLDVPVIYRDFNPTTHPDFQATAPHSTTPVYSPAIGPSGSCLTGAALSTTTECSNAVRVGIPAITLAADREPVFSNAQNIVGNSTSFNDWYHDTSFSKVILGRFLRLRQVGAAYEFDSQTDNETAAGINCGNGGTVKCSQFPGFWPLNGLGWGNYAATGKNFHFTSEVRYPFTYAGGETLSFRGDDDVFVYIGGKKVVDIGGIHGAQSGSVTLNASTVTKPNSGPGSGLLGLTVGQTYEIAVFQAERNTTGSNYKLTLQGFNRTVSTCTVPVPPSVFVRDYQAICGPGTKASWSVFQWKGVVTGAQTIQFRAATADTQAALPATKTDPSTVAIGTATSANTSATAWRWDGYPGSIPVSADLTAAGQTSKSWLRVYMTFNGGPILSEWAQLYDCVPAE